MLKSFAPIFKNTTFWRETELVLSVSQMLMDAMSGRLQRIEGISIL